MTQAKEQEWFPEWYFTGMVYQDLALLARSNPPEEWRRVRRVELLAVDPAGAGALGQPARLVLGDERRDHVEQRARAAQLAAARHPHRGAEAHAEVVPTGALLQPRRRRCRDKGTVTP